MKDFTKRSKIIKGIRVLSDRGITSNIGTYDNIECLKHKYRDFYDLEIPSKKSDFPKSLLRLLTIEKARKNSTIKYLKNCFIPVTHVLEKTKNWDKVDEIPYGTEHDKSEYGEDLDISSLSRLKGEREYIKACKHDRMNKVIDLVLDYD